MGKKKTRKTYTSKGQGPSVSKEDLRLARQAVPELTKALNKVAAWVAGKNPWITIANPNTNETNKRFIKVQANTLYGDPRRRANIYKLKDAE